MKVYNKKVVISFMILLSLTSCGAVDDEAVKEDTVSSEASLQSVEIEHTQQSKQASSAGESSALTPESEPSEDVIVKRDLDAADFKSLTVYDVYFEWEQPDEWEITDRDTIEKIVDLWNGGISDGNKLKKEDLDVGQVKAGPTAKVINFKRRDYTDLEEISMFYGQQSNYQYNVVFDGEMYMVDDELISAILDDINSERPEDD